MGSQYQTTEGGFDSGTQGIKTRAGTKKIHSQTCQPTMPPKKTTPKSNGVLRHHLVNNKPFMSSLPVVANKPIRKAFVYPSPSERPSILRPILSDFPIHADAHCLPSATPLSVNVNPPAAIVAILPDYNLRCELFDRMFSDQLSRNCFSRILSSQHALARDVRRGSQMTPYAFKDSITSVSHLVFLSQITVNYKQEFATPALKHEMSVNLSKSVHIASMNAVAFIQSAEPFATEVANIVLGDSDLTFLNRSIFLTVLKDNPTYRHNIVLSLRSIVHGRHFQDDCSTALECDPTLPNSLVLLAVGRISEAIALLRLFHDIYMSNRPFGYRYLEWLIAKSLPSSMGVDRPCDQIILTTLLLLIDYEKPEDWFPEDAEFFTQIRARLHHFQGLYCGRNDDAPGLFMAIPDSPPRSPDSPIAITPEPAETDDDDTSIEGSDDDEPELVPESALSCALRRHFGLTEALDPASPEIHVTPAQLDRFNRAAEPDGREPLSPLFPDIHVPEVIQYYTPGRRVKETDPPVKPGIWEFQGGVFLDPNVGGFDDPEDNLLCLYSRSSLECEEALSPPISPPSTTYPWWHHRKQQ